MVTALSMAWVRLPVVLVFAGALCACDLLAPSGPKLPQMWIHPNLGAEDLLDMFTDEHLAAWTQARRRLDGFQFHQGNVLTGECPYCRTVDGRSNSYEALAAAGAFRKLTRWGIPISIEVGALKPFNCENPAIDVGPTVAAASRAIANVKAAGGRVVSVSMDEPFTGGMLAGRCRLTSDEVARILVEYYLRPLQAEHPGVRVGLIEIYPGFTVDELLRHVDALTAAGYTVPYLLLDWDQFAPLRAGQTIDADLQRLQEGLRQRRIQFGIIVWGDDGSSSESWSEDALAMAERYRAALSGRPDRIVIESWSRADPRQDRGLWYPRMLPETDPMTMTSFVLRMSEWFRRRW